MQILKIKHNNGSDPVINTVCRWGLVIQLNDFISLYLRIMNMLLDPSDAVDGDDDEDGDEDVDEEDSFSIFTCCVDSIAGIFEDNIHSLVVGE